MPAAPHPRMHGITHVPGGPDPIPAVSTRIPFYEAVSQIAGTRDLRGYWRLGEPATGPFADSSGRATPVPMVVTGTGTAPESVPGADTGDGDFAIQFNPDTDDGTAAKWLKGPNNWGSSSTNPFDYDMGTVAGWVVTQRNTDTGTGYRGGIFSTQAYAGLAGTPGYVLGVYWPAGGVLDGVALSDDGLSSGVIFHYRGNSMLYGPQLPEDTWVFACAVKDTDSTRIYIDGALVASGPSVTGYPGTNPEPVIGLWNLSSAGGGLDPGVMNGGVDEVSVWADPLDDGEIALLAASGGLAQDPEVRTMINVHGDYAAGLNQTVLATTSMTVTLPLAVGSRGQEVTVKNIGSGTVTVDGAGQQIDGSSSAVTLTAAQARTFVSDGAGWQQVGAYA